MARRTTSPLASFLCTLLLFAAKVVAVSVVLGIDLGTEYIKAALVKPGIPLEIVLTKDSRRKEISAVAFKPPNNDAPKLGSYPERFYGSDAMALSGRFPGDVYPNLKTLLGLPFESEAVAEYALRHPALQVEKNPVRGTAAFKSAGAFAPEEEAWMVEELLAMELQSVRANAEALAGKGSKIKNVVLTVPPFYTVEEKRAVELAAELAGLRVLSLISDGLAVGLNYATSRTFPLINDGAKPEYHMVLDIGAGSTKATVMRFQSRNVKNASNSNKTVQEVQVLGNGWDQTLGGDALNYLIVDDMVKQFVESPEAKEAAVTSESIQAAGRTMAKLKREAERIRHVLSANQNTQVSFEALHSDVNFKYKLTRAELETMAGAHTEKVGVTVREALKSAGLEISDLGSVILHGGASRTPFVQKELEKVLGSADKIRTNVNSDESAVFGAGFRAADISPGFRVKPITVVDLAGHSAGMRWKNDEGKDKHQRIWTATSALGAAPKEVTFPNREDFSVSFYQLVGSVEKDTKIITTSNLTATVTVLVEKHKCDKSEVKFKVGVRLSSENGEVEVTKAILECETEEAEKETFVDGVKNIFGFGGKQDQKPVAENGEEVDAEGDSSASAETSTTSNSSSSSSAPISDSVSASAEPAAKIIHTVIIPVKYTIDKVGIPRLPRADLLKVKDRLIAFEASDNNRRDREEALNQLEAFTYKVRDLVDNEIFMAAAKPEEKTALEQKSAETGDWLYEDGVDAPRAELLKRLRELQDIVHSIQKRIDEQTERPELVQRLKDALDSIKLFITSAQEKMKDYEDFKSSAMASLSSTPDAPANPVDLASSANNVVNLEDDDTGSTTRTKTSRTMEDVVKERGPVPPLYAPEDIKEIQDLHDNTKAWLEEKVIEQDKLGVMDDPVLLVKDLKVKREKLDKAGLEIAMRSARKYERKNKNDKSSSSERKSKAESKTKSDPPPVEMETAEEALKEEMKRKHEEL